MTDSTVPPGRGQAGPEVIVPAKTDFDAFYAAAYPALVGQVFVMLGDLDEAQDVVQDAFGRASARWSRVREEVPEFWVRRQAFALAAKRLRRRARPNLLDRLAQRRTTRGLAPADQQLGSHLAIARLPAAYRAVLALHYIAELPVEEIASLLKLPAQAVAVQLEHARKTLSRRLSERQGASHA
jgi:RNA polymerase sigma-70 factor, ECF subfamily